MYFFLSLKTQNILHVKNPVSALGLRDKTNNLKLLLYFTAEFLQICMAKFVVFWKEGISSHFQALVLLFWCTLERLQNHTCLVAGVKTMLNFYSAPYSFATKECKRSCSGMGVLKRFYHKLYKNKSHINDLWMSSCYVHRRKQNSHWVKLFSLSFMKIYKETQTFSYHMKNLLISQKTDCKGIQTLPKENSAFSIYVHL